MTLKRASALFASAVLGTAAFAQASYERPDVSADHCVLKELRARIDSGTIPNTNSGEKVRKYVFNSTAFASAMQDCETKTGQSSSYKNLDGLTIWRTETYFKPGSAVLE